MAWVKGESEAHKKRVERAVELWGVLYEELDENLSPELAAFELYRASVMKKIVPAMCIWRTDTPREVVKKFAWLAKTPNMPINPKVKEVVDRLKKHVRKICPTPLDALYATAELYRYLRVYENPHLTRTGFIVPKGFDEKRISKLIHQYFDGDLEELQERAMASLKWRHAQTEAGPRKVARCPNCGKVWARGLKEELEETCPRCGEFE